MKKFLYVSILVLCCTCLISCSSTKDAVAEASLTEETPGITEASIINAKPAASFGENEEAIALYKAASEAIKAGDYEKAETLLRQALELEPEFIDALDNLGIVLRRLGKTDEAIEVLKKSIALNPYNAIPYSSLCIAYMDLLDYQNALKTCQDEIEKIPDDGEAWYNEGSVYMKMKEYKNAIPSYKQAITLLKDKDEKRMYDAIYSLGFCFYIIKDWDNAISYMEMALEYFPDDKDLKDFLASARDWKDIS